MEHSPERHESPSEPPLGSLEYMAKYGMFDEATERQKRQEEIHRKATEMMIHNYWLHMNEQKEKFWYWFNNERLEDD